MDRPHFLIEYLDSTTIECGTLKLEFVSWLGLGRPSQIIIKFESPLQISGMEKEPLRYVN